MDHLDAKLRQYFAAEQQALADLTPPEDLEERLLAVVAQYQSKQKAQEQPQLRVLPKRRVRKPHSRWQAFVASVAAAVLVLVSITSFLPQDSSWSGWVEIQPAHASSYGIDVEQGFVIRAGEPLSYALADQALAVSPEFSYTLEQVDDTTYLVVPDEPLERNTLYSLSFDPERSQAEQPARAENSWAFQTEPAFSLVETDPLDTASLVPVELPLTLTFNEELAEEAALLVQISPETAGDWQVSGRQLIFTPAQGWQAETVYEITVAAELASADGDPLGQLLVSRFETGSVEMAERFRFALTEENRLGGAFGSNEQIRWTVQLAGAEPQSESYQVELYQITDAQAYLQALETYIGSYSWTKAAEVSRVETLELEAWQSYEVLAETEDADQQTLVLAESLPQGFYLAELSRDGCLRQLLFQVSDYSAYASLAKRQNLFWLHDAAGQPWTEAAVQVYRNGRSSLLGTTDEDGLLIANVQLAQEEAAQLYLLERDGVQLVLAAEANQASDTQVRLRSNYRTSLSLAQQQYQAGQRLEYFGTFYAREESAQEPRVALRLRGGAWRGDQALELQPELSQGSFQGGIDLPALQTGWYALDLYVDDLYCEGSYFYLEQAQAQEWQLSLQPQTAYAQAGEALQWLLQASYQGDPLSGLAVTVYDPQSGLDYQLETDEAGEASLSLTLAQVATEEPLHTYRLEASALLPGIGMIESEAQVQSLQQDFYLDAQVERWGREGYTLTLEAYQLSLDEAGREVLWQPYSAALDVALQVLSYQQVQGEDGASRREAQLEQSQTLRLTQGALTYEGSLYNEGGYQLALRVQGGQWSLSLPGWQAEPALEITLRDALGLEKTIYTAGDTVRLSLYQEDHLLAPQTGAQSLFVLAQKPGLQAVLGEDNAYRFAYQEAVAAAWCVYYQDGQYMLSDTLQLPGQREQLPLQVELELEPEQPLPGETLRLQARVTNGEGQALGGVALNFNLTDAALEQEQPRETLPVPFYRNLHSHAAEDFSADQALCRVERSTVPEEAATQQSLQFVTLHTDADGTAVVELQLPEDTDALYLQWQAAQAGRVVRGGQALPLQQQFRLESNFGTSYLEGDAPLLRLRAQGLNDSSLDVDYQISIPSLDYQESFRGEAGAWHAWQLPELSAGSHELRLEAVCGSLRAGQTVQFQVRESFFQHSHLRSWPLSEGLAGLEQTQGRVTLIFSNQEKAQTIADLYRIASQQSQRFDHKLAAFVAADLLDELCGWQAVGLVQNRQSLLTEYQTAGGGLSLLPGGNANFELTALSAPLAEDYLDKAALTSYLWAYYENATDTAERALALCGLGALGQPVLLDIEQMLNEEVAADDGMSRLYLALAQLACGNGVAAKEEAALLLALYTETLDNGQMRANGISAETPDEITEVTASLALLANAFDLPQATPLYAYLRSQSDSLPYLLEQVRILQARSQQLQQPAYFRYQTGDRQEDVNLENHTLYTLSLSQKQLAELTVQGVAGDLTLTVLWQEQGPPEMSAPSPELGLSRSYRGQNGDVQLSARGFIEVRLDYSFGEDSPAGQYTLVDALPAGLRFCSFDGQASSSQVWFLQQDGAKLRFVIEKEAGASSGTVVYQAYSVTPGSYRAETPYLYHNHNTVLHTQGQEQRVDIQ